MRKVVGSDKKRIVEILGGSREICLSLGLPFPYTPQNAKDFMRFALQENTSGSALIQVICVEEKMIGLISLKNIDKNDRHAEVGYWLCEKEWGGGYMTQALKLMTKQGFGELKLQKIYAFVCVENPGSQKVLQKAGYEREATLKKHKKWKGRKWADVEIYSKFKK